jgi:hypothetical protein
LLFHILFKFGEVAGDHATGPPEKNITVIWGYAFPLGETLSEAENGKQIPRNFPLAPAGTVLPQVLVSAKSLLSVPVMEILVKFTATLPLLLSVTLLERLLVPTG